MTQDEIIAMAREAGLPTLTEYGYESLERFAALVAAREREKHNSPSWETVDDAIAAEREACAKVCEETPWSNWFQSDCAAAIRARGEK